MINSKLQAGKGSFPYLKGHLEKAGFSPSFLLICPVTERQKFQTPQKAVRLIRFLPPKISDPTLKFVDRQTRQHVHAFFAVIQARQMGKFLATMLHEDLAVFAIDLFECFKAIS